MCHIKVVGFDPSLRNWGVAKVLLNVRTLDYVIDDLFLIQPDSKKSGKEVRKNSDDLRRCQVLYDGMVDACDNVTFAIAEVPHGSQSARSMASYGMCVGVLSGCPIPLIQVSAIEVKIAAVGKKTASKDEMIEWATHNHPQAPWITRKVKGEYQLTDANEHLADALATIEAGIRTQQFKQAIAVYKSMSGIAA